MANPVIGTAECIQKCGNDVTVHEILKGRGKRSMLYTHCPGCGCDQRMGDNVQSYYRENTTPRPGYEHLFPAQDNDQPSSESGQDDLQPEEPPESTSDKVSDVKDDTQKPVKKGGVVGLVIFVGVVLTGIAAATRS